MLGRADWLTCNAREATLLTGAGDPLRALALLTQRSGRAGVLVRTGPDGCLLGHRGGTGAAGARLSRSPRWTPTGPVTRTRGYFSPRWLAGRTEAEAVRRANAAAALSVTRRGPATGPTRAELAQFLGSRQAEQGPQPGTDPHGARPKHGLLGEGARAARRGAATRCQPRCFATAAPVLAAGLTRDGSGKLLK